MTRTFFALSTALSLASLATAACHPGPNGADLQAALKEGGKGFVLSLCKGQTYDLTEILKFTAADQEISTEGYPTGDDRAKLVVKGDGQTVAVKGTDNEVHGCKLKNLQFDGNHDGITPRQERTGGIVEMGGSSTMQIVENLKISNPRGWTCMHIQEGPFKCANITVQNNEIGPCGVHETNQWSDGISLSCKDALVQNNYIVDATDGGIVIFGAPGSIVRNNTIVSKTRTLLGGINMVDQGPWKPMGIYEGTVVENNHIIGEFATADGDGNLGPNEYGAFIKIGIAIGPRVWWGDNAEGASYGATVRGNKFSGAMGFGIALGGVKDFTVEGNVFENAVFMGEYGPSCPHVGPPHAPTALLKQPDTLTNVHIVDGDGDEYDFVDGKANGLLCFVAPAADSNSWPIAPAPPVEVDGGDKAVGGMSIENIALQCKLQRLGRSTRRSRV